MTAKGMKASMARLRVGPQTSMSCMKNSIPKTTSKIRQLALGSRLIPSGAGNSKNRLGRPLPGVSQPFEATPRERLETHSETIHGCRAHVEPILNIVSYPTRPADGRWEVGTEGNMRERQRLFPACPQFASNFGFPSQAHGKVARSPKAFRARGHKFFGSVRPSQFAGGCTLQRN